MKFPPRQAPLVFVGRGLRLAAQLAHALGDFVQTLGGRGQAFQAHVDLVQQAGRAATPLEQPPPSPAPPRQGMPTAGDLAKIGPVALTRFLPGGQAVGQHRLDLALLRHRADGDVDGLVEPHFALPGTLQAVERGAEHRFARQQLRPIAIASLLGLAGHDIHFVGRKQGEFTHLQKV